MSAAEIQLRTTAFGGFQKQDVLNYIEAANREHLERLEALRRELEEAAVLRETLEEEKRQSQEQARELSGRTEALEQELQALRQSADAQAEELAAARERLGQLEERLRQAGTEQARLEPLAQAYESLKERTAGIELEAHQRAQGIIAQARTQAAAVRQETEQWLQGVQESYGRMREDMTYTVTHTGEALAGVCRALEELDGKFARQSERFDGIVAAYRQTEEPAPEEETEE